MANERFRPREHVRKSADFRRAFDAKCSAASTSLIVYVCVNGLTWNRVGLSVSKKLGNAVIRNRLRRQLREAFRKSNSALPRGYDIIVIPRGRSLVFAELCRDFAGVIMRAIERAGMVRSS